MREKFILRPNQKKPISVKSITNGAKIAIIFFLLQQLSGRGGLQSDKGACSRIYMPTFKLQYFDFNHARVILLRKKIEKDLRKHSHYNTIITG